MEGWSLGSLYASSVVPVPKRICLLIPVTVSLPNGPLNTQVMIDSGAARSFIDRSFLENNNIPMRSLPEPVNLTMGDGTPSAAGPVLHEAPVHLTIATHHHEEIVLKVTKLGQYPIILGMDWLWTHNPAINWKNHVVSFHSDFCNTFCVHHNPLTQALLSCSVLDPAPEPTLEEYQLCQLAFASVSCPSEDHHNQHPHLFSDSAPIHLSTMHTSATTTAEPNLTLHNLETAAPVIIPEEYQDFAALFKDKELGTLPPRRSFDHAIPIEPGAKVPFGPLYTLSQKELEALKEYIAENLAKGFIRKSQSPAGAPVLFTPKKDNKLRLCVDYRGLNKITIKNRCPLPLITETLDQLREASTFTKLDLKGAYNLVRIAEGDEWKTAFRTRYGHFEYLVMPFGLTNAPATFQAFLNDVLREHLDNFVVIYLDDILIYSRDARDHVQHVRMVLSKLQAADLQVNLDKCVFHASEVEFLGYVISHNGIRMDSSKVQAVLEWPTPASVRDIQVFLGFANFYRRFIQNFSKVVAPITRLLKKDVPFVWDDAAQKAFDSLRTAFTTEPVLAHFNPDLPCVLEPDASKTALGAVCSQPDAKGVLHPLGFYSRSLTPPERNYHVHDTELLAAIEGLEHWRHFFAYSNFPATILTDHKNLEHFSEKRPLSERQVRYSERLSKFNPQLVYRPGVQNGAADALSRMHIAVDSPEEGEGSVPQALLPMPLKFEDVAFLAPSTSVPLQPVLVTVQLQTDAPDGIVNRIRDAYPSDESTQTLIDDLSRDPDAHVDHALDQGLLFYKGLLLVPGDNDIKRDILTHCHDDPAAGHFGLQKTFELVNRTFYWSGMRQFVKMFVTTCDTCQRNKSPRHKPYGLLQSLPIPETPWSSISMDFITQLPPSNGFTSILVFVDRLTKMAHFVPTHDEVDANETMTLFLEHVVRAHGLPDDIVSDRGTTFTAQFTQAFMSALQVKQNLSTAFHPQTDGQTERTNATLEQYLRCFLNYQQDNWAQLLPLAEFAYNNTVHTSTNQTPFFALHGYHPRFSIHVPRVARNSPEANRRIQLLKDIQADLKFHITAAQETQARYYNQHVQAPPDFVPGDKVWLLRRNIKTSRPSDKLDYRRLGPFKIVAPVGTRSFRLDLPASMSRIHPVFHVSLLEPFHANTISGRQAPPPPPIEVEGQIEYEVEAILDSRWRYRKLQYFVDWKDCTPDERTWEPADHVAHCDELIAEFHRRFPTKPGPVPVAPGGRS